MVKNCNPIVMLPQKKKKGNAVVMENQKKINELKCF